MPDLAVSVRRAQPPDAAAVADLVNRAYAIEEFFVEGDRTSPGEIVEMMARGEFIVLERGTTLGACVYVEAPPCHGHQGYFGMLSVLPELQGLGLGKRMVKIAEAVCEASGATTMSIRIINLREELARWYRSLGYREVGTTPYTHRPVKRPCHFVDMQRSLTSSLVAA
jgi:ribosomal protein S18 acetylase RimI-like enzyme